MTFRRGRSSFKPGNRAVCCTQRVINTCMFDKLKARTPPTSLNLPVFELPQEPYLWDDNNCHPWKNQYINKRGSLHILSHHQGAFYRSVCVVQIRFHCTNVFMCFYWMWVFAFSLWIMCLRGVSVYVCRSSLAVLCQRIEDLCFFHKSIFTGCQH